MIPRYKFWFEKDGKYVLGEGSYKLLKNIQTMKSIKFACDSLHMSYRYCWGVLKKIESRFGEKLIISERGGKYRGRTSLTQAGVEIVKKYEKYHTVLSYVLERPYLVPALAVDGILITKNKILLIKRKNEPFKGYYAIPGGFVEYGETVESAVVREVYEETGLKVKTVSLIGVYSGHSRDPRGHTVSVVFLLKKVGGALKASDDADKVEWVDLNKISTLAFDHNRIIEDFVKKFQSSFLETRR